MMRKIFKEKFTSGISTKVKQAKVELTDEAVRQTSRSTKWRFT